MQVFPVLEKRKDKQRVPQKVIQVANASNKILFPWLRWQISKNFEELYKVFTKYGKFRNMSCFSDKSLSTKLRLNNWPPTKKRIPDVKINQLKNTSHLFW